MRSVSASGSSDESRRSYSSCSRYNPNQLVFGCPCVSLNRVNSRGWYWNKFLDDGVNRSGFDAAFRFARGILCRVKKHRGNYHNRHTSPASNRWYQSDDHAIGNLRVHLVEIANVFVVDKDVDVRPDLAVIEQLRPDCGVLPQEIVERGLHGPASHFDFRFTARLLAHRRRNLNLDRHVYLFLLLFHFHGIEPYIVSNASRVLRLSNNTGLPLFRTAAALSDDIHINNCGVIITTSALSNIVANHA